MTCDYRSELGRWPRFSIKHLMLAIFITAGTLAAVRINGNRIRALDRWYGPTIATSLAQFNKEMELMAGEQFTPVNESEIVSGLRKELRGLAGDEEWKEGFRQGVKMIITKRRVFDSYMRFDSNVNRLVMVVSVPTMGTSSSWAVIIRENVVPPKADGE